MQTVKTVVDSQDICRLAGHLHTIADFQGDCRQLWIHEHGLPFRQDHHNKEVGHMVTITEGVSISKVMEVAGVGSATNGATPSSC